MHWSEQTFFEKKKIKVFIEIYLAKNVIKKNLLSLLV